MEKPQEKNSTERRPSDIAPFSSYHQGFDARKADPLSFYHLFTSVLVPRPIGWVSTLSPEGTPNLAPFSFFGGISGEPPMIYISVGRRHGRVKDTAANLALLPHFVVHICNGPLAPQMVQTSAEYPPEVDEIKEAGLTVIPSVNSKVPRVAEAPVAMECELVRTLELGEGPSSIFIGEVTFLHICEEILKEHQGRPKVDIVKLDPLARLGLRGYATMGEYFELPRPTI